MTTINNQIIDRIILLRNELLQNYNSENRILFGLINILYNIDEMNINTVNNHLTFYYTNYHENLIDLNNINFLTGGNYNINSINDYLSFSLNSFDRNLFNYDQQLNDDLEDSVEYEENSDSEDIFSSEDSEEENLFNENIPDSFNVRTINDFGYTYNNYHILPQSNLYNLSNIYNVNDFYINNDINIINNSEIQNTFMENVPIVLKESSLLNLKVSKYENLDDEIKSSNKKCMINLKDFNDDDIVRILPCNHIFIKNDIDNWLLNSSYKCPICRSSAGEHYAKVN